MTIAKIINLLRKKYKNFELYEEKSRCSKSRYIQVSDFDSNFIIRFRISDHHPTLNCGVSDIYLYDGYELDTIKYLLNQFISNDYNIKRLGIAEQLLL